MEHPHPSSQAHLFTMKGCIPLTTYPPASHFCTHSLPPSSTILTKALLPLREENSVIVPFFDMLHLNSPDREVDNAADAVRSLIERLEYANFYQDAPK